VAWRSLQRQQGPEARQARLQVGPGHGVRRRTVGSAQGPGQAGVGHLATAQHQAVAAGLGAGALGVGHGPDLAVGDDRDAHRGADVGHPVPVGRRPVALQFGAGMHHQLTGATGGQRLGGVDAAVVIAVAQAHLGRHRHLRRHRAPHRRHDGVQQVGLVEQHRAATVTVHRLGRAAEVQVDALGTQLGQARRIVGQAGRVTAQQLGAHRRAGTGAAAVQQLGHHPGEDTRGQQLVGDADELGDAAIDAAHGGQHFAQRVVEQALHGREQDGHQPRSVEVRGA